MLSYIDKIRETSERLLKECKVDLVIGFRKGTVAMMNEPYIAKVPEDVRIWSGTATAESISQIILRIERKISVLLPKGCDSRNIVTHIIENKIKREQLVIIGVPCKGMIDRRRVASMINGDIKAVIEDENNLTVQGDGFEEKLKKKDVLQQNCTVCIHRNPVIHDEIVAELVEEQQDVDRYTDVREIESMSSNAKEHYFEELLSPCIRCYACRNACPLCYCPTCFVDESRPQWVGKSQDPVDVKTFHFLRAYHCAGRCTDCGACERACPVGINMRVLTKKLEKDCLDSFGWEAGMSLDVRPPLDTYKPEDPDDFIK